MPIGRITDTVLKTVDNIKRDDIRPGEPVKANDIRALVDHGQRTHLGRGAGHVQPNLHAFFAKQVPVGRWIRALALQDAPHHSTLSLSGGSFLCGEAELTVDFLHEGINWNVPGIILTNEFFELHAGRYGWVKFVMVGPAKRNVNKNKGAPPGRVPPRL